MKLQPDADMVWMYWAGPMPEHIAFCMNTVKYHHPGRVRVLGPEDFAYCKKAMGIPDSAQFRYAHQADIIRVYMLYIQGGFWVDSDFLCFKPLDTLLEPAPDDTTFAGYTRDDVMLPVDGKLLPFWDNDFMWAARGGSPLLEDFYNVLSRMLRHNGFVIEGWHTPGAAILTPLAYQRKNVYKVPTDDISYGRRLCIGLDAEWFGEWNPPASAAGMMLVNSASAEYLSNKKLTSIIKSKTVLGALFRAADRRMLAGP